MSFWDCFPKQLAPLSLCQKVILSASGILLGEKKRGVERCSSGFRLVMTRLVQPLALWNWRRVFFYGGVLRMRWKVGRGSELGPLLFVSWHRRSIFPCRFSFSDLLGGFPELASCFQVPVLLVKDLRHVIFYEGVLAMSLQVDRGSGFGPLMFFSLRVITIFPLRSSVQRLLYDYPELVSFSWVSWLVAVRYRCCGMFSLDLGVSCCFG